MSPEAMEAEIKQLRAELAELRRNYMEHHHKPAHGLVGPPGRPTRSAMSERRWMARAAKALAEVSDVMGHEECFERVVFTGYTPPSHGVGNYYCHTHSEYFTMHDDEHTRRLHAWVRSL
jgi:hypothetical protein